MTLDECATAHRFIHTPDGWQEWLEHAGECPNCIRELEES